MQTLVLNIKILARAWSMITAILVEIKFAYIIPMMFKVNINII